ncbi:MAG: hypothetical protein ACKO3M_11510 [Rubrivivax sp.]
MTRSLCTTGRDERDTVAAANDANAAPRRSTAPANLPCGVQP